MRRRSRLQESIRTASDLREAEEELEVLLEMSRDDEAGADDELAAALERIHPMMDRVELTTKMTGEHGFEKILANPEE